MKGLHKVTAVLAVSISISNLAWPRPAAAPEWPSQDLREDRPGLSVMTFNVKGLPFPIATGRPQALARIGRRLARLRHEGRQPDVILLQEAFTRDAKAIARQAGYAFVALGPQPSSVLRDSDASQQDPAWTRGEGLGKWIDSGLMILSDFPIVRPHTMAFPDTMCAGFDCLAAKGVQIAWIKVPGQPRPIALANTHLNSRKASGVSRMRADAAYFAQTKRVRAFLEAAIDPATDLIFGGDFNIGNDPGRSAASRIDQGFVPGGQEATAAADCRNCTDGLKNDLLRVRKRDKDKQFFRAGPDLTLRAESIAIPFGAQNGGFALSDHLGYVVHYSLTR